MPSSVVLLTHLVQCEDEYDEPVVVQGELAVVLHERRRHPHEPGVDQAEQEAGRDGLESEIEIVG